MSAAAWLTGTFRRDTILRFHALVAFAAAALTTAALLRYRCGRSPHTRADAAWH